MRRQLTRQAVVDIAAALDWSYDHFGREQRSRYERLIARGLVAITAVRPPLLSRDACDISPGLRLFHLRHLPALAGSLVRRPRHVIAYRQVSDDLVVALRVLHEAMDLPARLGRSDAD